LNLTVTGTSTGGGSSAVSLAVFFADYSLTATPSGTTVTAGKNATYTITVTPSNGFNQPVLLSCPAAYPGIPVDTVCNWNPPVVTPSGAIGTSVSSTLTITTVAEGTRLFPRSPPSRIPPGLTQGILLFALLTFLAAIAMGMTRPGPWMRPRFRWVVLLVSIALIALAVGCENYVNPININPEVTGTPAGTSNILLTGTLGNGGGVTRNTVVSLSVLP